MSSSSKNTTILEKEKEKATHTSAFENDILQVYSTLSKSVFYQMFTIDPMDTLHLSWIDFLDQVCLKHPDFSNYRGVARLYSLWAHHEAYSPSLFSKLQPPSTIQSQTLPFFQQPFHLILLFPNQEFLSLVEKFKSKTEEDLNFLNCVLNEQSSPLMIKTCFEGLFCNVDQSFQTWLVSKTMFRDVKCIEAIDFHFEEFSSQYVFRPLCLCKSNVCVFLIDSVKESATTSFRKNAWTSFFLEASKKT